jgi:hypothetical protein
VRRRGRQVHNGRRFTHFVSLREMRAVRQFMFAAEQVCTALGMP